MIPESSERIVVVFPSSCNIVLLILLKEDA